jgi:hypothetical protein
VATGPVLDIGPPDAKWEVRLVSAQQRFSALSTEPVVATVKAYQAGAPLNPTTGTVQMAFLATPLAQPGAGDWKAGSWDTNEIGEYVAQCEIGPAGAVTLTAGQWWVWVQITLNPVTVVRQVGSIVVE